MMNVTLPSWMMVTSPPPGHGQSNHEELKKRLMVLGEHLFFTVWAYYVIFLYPNGDNSTDQTNGRNHDLKTTANKGGFAGMAQNLFASTSRALSDPSTMRSSTEVSQSWLANTQLCWTEPAFPSEAFHLFYAAKCATHIGTPQQQQVHFTY